MHPRGVTDEPGRLDVAPLKRKAEDPAIARAVGAPGQVEQPGTGGSVHRRRAFVAAGVVAHVDVGLRGGAGCRPLDALVQVRKGGG